MGIGRPYDGHEVLRGRTGLGSDSGEEAQGTHEG